MMSEMKPQISTGKQFSTIWIVPIVALLLGVWMVIHTLMNEGPEFQISFESADDLVAGKTKVKLLSVDIGQVEVVSLNPEVSGVVVTVKLEKEHQNLLREDTQFWVERARVGAGGISGLGTLLSGAYIKLGPGSGKTLLNILSMLGKVLAMAVERGQLEDNPCRNLKKLLARVGRQQSEEASHVDSWSREEVRRLLDFARISVR